MVNAIGALGNDYCLGRWCAFPVIVLSIVGNLVVSILGLKYVEQTDPCQDFTLYSFTCAVIICNFISLGFNVYLLFLDGLTFCFCSGERTCRFSNRVIFGISLLEILILFIWGAILNAQIKDTDCQSSLDHNYSVYLKVVFWILVVLTLPALGLNTLTTAMTIKYEREHAERLARQSGEGNV